MSQRDKAQKRDARGRESERELYLVLVNLSINAHDAPSPQKMV